MTFLLQPPERWDDKCTSPAFVTTLVILLLIFFLSLQLHKQHSPYTGVSLNVNDTAQWFAPFWTGICLPRLPQSSFLAHFPDILLRLNVVSLLVEPSHSPHSVPGHTAVLRTARTREACVHRKLPCWLWWARGIYMYKRSWRDPILSIIIACLWGGWQAWRVLGMRHRTLSSGTIDS